MKGTGEKGKETRVLASGRGRSRSSGAAATRGGQVSVFRGHVELVKGRKGCMEGSWTGHLCYPEGCVRVVNRAARGQIIGFRGQLKS